METFFFQLTISKGVHCALKLCALEVSFYNINDSKKIKSTLSIIESKNDIFLNFLCKLAQQARLDYISIVQLAKILLVPKKCEIIILLSNSHCSNIGIAILNFSIFILVKLSLLIILAIFWYNVKKKFYFFPLFSFQ